MPTTVHVGDAESVKIDSDEDGFHIVFVTTHGGRYDVRIQDVAEALYDAVRADIGPWLYERDTAKAAFRCNPDESVGLAEYRRSEHDHERMTGQHADPYDVDDPKHPDWHSIHADHYDQREGK